MDLLEKMEVHLSLKYMILKSKEKKNSELSNFSEEASLEIEIKKEEEKTTRHNITPE